MSNSETTPREATLAAYALTSYAAMARLIEHTGTDVRYIMEAENPTEVSKRALLTTASEIVERARVEPSRGSVWNVTREARDTVLLELLGQTLVLGPLELNELSDQLGRVIRAMPEEQRPFGLAVSVLLLAFLSAIVDNAEIWMQQMLPEGGQILSGDNPEEVLDQLRELLEGRPEGSTLQ